MGALFGCNEVLPAVLALRVTRNYSLYHFKIS
jgi:hypothetical protein